MTSCGAELIGARFAAWLAVSALPFAAAAPASTVLLAADFFAFFADDFRAGFFAAVPLPASSDAASSAPVWLFTFGLRPRAGFLASAFTALVPSDPSSSDTADVLAGFFVAFLRADLPADLLSFTAV